MLRGWWRVIFRIFTPQSNTLLVVYPYIPHSSWLNPTKSPCVMVSCWVKTKRKSEYPKGELPSRRTNWCQFVHRSQAEEQDVSLHWWNLDLEFDDVRDMFMGIHWVNLSNTYTYIYIYNQYIYIYIHNMIMYKSYISSNGYEQIFGGGCLETGTTWFMAIEKGSTIINHEILSWPYVQEKTHFWLVVSTYHLEKWWS